jgi:hypothetical protein
MQNLCSYFWDIKAENAVYISSSTAFLQTFWLTFQPATSSTSIYYKPTLQLKMPPTWVKDNKNTFAGGLFSEAIPKSTSRVGIILVMMRDYLKSITAIFIKGK